MFAYLVCVKIRGGRIPRCISMLIMEQIPDEIFRHGRAPLPAGITMKQMIKKAQEVGNYRLIPSNPYCIKSINATFGPGTRDLNWQLYQACADWDYDRANDLITRGATDVNWGLIFCATHSRIDKFIDLFICHGAEAFISALNAAAEYGQIEVIKFIHPVYYRPVNWAELLKRTADRGVYEYVLSTNHITDAMVRVVVASPHLDIIINNNDSAINFFGIILVEAAALGNLEYVKMIWKKFEFHHDYVITRALAVARGLEHDECAEYLKKIIMNISL